MTTPVKTASLFAALRQMWCAVDPPPPGLSDRMVAAVRRGSRGSPRGVAAGAEQRTPQRDRFRILAHTADEATRAGR